MTITSNISVQNDNLVVQGKTILTKIPDNIILTPESDAGFVSGAFIGATFEHSKSLHVFPIGVLEGLRFLCCFRFKLWWMTQRMGSCGKEIPWRQFMLLESKDEVEGNGDDAPTIYTVFLPLLEGQFRAVLQGNEKNEIEICLESGDKAVETSQGTHLVYVHAGTNPFEVIRQSVKAAERHMQTFHHREKKKYDSFFHVRKRWDKAIGQEVVRLKEENAEQAKKICDLGFQLEDTKKEIAQLWDTVRFQGCGCESCKDKVAKTFAV